LLSMSCWNSDRHRFKCRCSFGDCSTQHRLTVPARCLNSLPLSVLPPLHFLPSSHSTAAALFSPPFVCTRSTLFPRSRSMSQLLSRVAAGSVRSSRVRARWSALPVTARSMQHAPLMAAQFSSSATSAAAAAPASAAAASPTASDSVASAAAAAARAARPTVPMRSAQLRAQRPRSASLHPTAGVSVSTAESLASVDAALDASKCGPSLPAAEMVSVGNAETGERMGPRGKRTDTKWTLGSRRDMRRLMTHTHTHTHNTDNQRSSSRSLSQRIETF
jgi:hypothetical protein